VTDLYREPLRKSLAPVIHISALVYICGVSYIAYCSRGFYVLLAATVTPFCSHVRQLSDKLTIVKAVV
jgi:hypothetical protein